MSSAVLNSDQTNLVFDALLLLLSLSFALGGAVDDCILRGHLTHALLDLLRLEPDVGLLGEDFSTQLALVGSPNILHVFFSLCI